MNDFEKSTLHQRSAMASLFGDVYFGGMPFHSKPVMESK
jgi:hypothetical protein